MKNNFLKTVTATFIIALSTQPALAFYDGNYKRLSNLMERYRYVVDLEMDDNSMFRIQNLKNAGKNEHGYRTLLIKAQGENYYALSDYNANDQKVIINKSHWLKLYFSKNKNCLGIGDRYIFLKDTHINRASGSHVRDFNYEYKYDDEMEQRDNGHHHSNHGRHMHDTHNNGGHHAHDTHHDAYQTTTVRKKLHMLCR